MANIATGSGLLLCCIPGWQYRFVTCPEDGGLAARGWRVVSFDVLARGLVLGQDTFLIDDGKAATRRIFERKAGKALLTPVEVKSVEDMDKLHASTGVLVDVRSAKR
ncbi:MAG: hypothetical protein HY328_14040 [Chloroflexi bacterium]|nr:hypothetical protein [Chloroflexota bacterium]